MILPHITFLIHPNIFRFQEKILRSKEKIFIFEDFGLLLVLLSPVWGLKSTGYLNLERGGLSVPMDLLSI